MTSDAVDTALERLLTRAGMDIADLPAADGPEEGFLTRYATLGWRLRRLGPVGDDAARDTALEAAEVLGIAAWTVADAARVLLLRRRLLPLPDAEAVRLVERVVRTGDNAEREALLKGLMALPDPGRFVATAVDAARAAAVSTFRALARDNAYPLRHFPDPAFRALVLKAMHMGEPLSRLHGLDARLDDDLARMARDYASELRLAGRPLSADFALVTARSAL